MRKTGEVFDLLTPYIPEVHVLDPVTAAGLAADLPEVMAAMQCAIEIPFEGALGFADWVALAEGFDAGFAKAEFLVAPDQLRAVGAGPQDTVMVMRSARDPATVLVSLTMMQRGHTPTGGASEGPLREGPVVIEFTILHRAVGA